jgi:TRAP-type C4-dicarboxylate transport system permease small subunit
MGAVVRTLLRLCDTIALGALALMFAVVATNVLARAVFDYSGQAVNFIIPGAIEISRYALMVTVLSSLPRAAEAGMVRVDLLIERLPPVLAGALERLWNLAIAAFGGITGWLLLAEALLQRGRGDATQDLEMPLWLFTGFAGIALMVLGLTGLRLALRPRAGR